MYFTFENAGDNTKLMKQIVSDKKKVFLDYILLFVVTISSGFYRSKNYLTM